MRDTNAGTHPHQGDNHHTTYSGSDIPVTIVVDSESTQAAKDKDVVSPIELLRVIWKRLWVVVLMAFVFAGTALGVSLMQEPTYEASVKILVAQDAGQGQSGSPGSLEGEVQGLQHITTTMAEAVRSRPVAETVIGQLRLQMTPEGFLNNLNAKQIRNTQFIKADYKDANPERAQRVANTIGNVFSEQISEVSPSANAVTATVWERAEVPAAPVSPRPVRNGLLALALGAMLGVALVFLLEHVDDALRSPEEAEQISGVPNLGVVPEFKGA